MHTYASTLLLVLLLVYTHHSIHVRNRCVGMDQLEAAFEIADTDGDGMLDTSEIQEALQVYTSHTLTYCIPHIPYILCLY
jgi:EF-hand domain